MLSPESRAQLPGTMDRAAPRIPLPAVSAERALTSLPSLIQYVMPYTVHAVNLVLHAYRVNGVNRVDTVLKIGHSNGALLSAGPLEAG